MVSRWQRLHYSVRELTRREASRKRLQLIRFVTAIHDKIMAGGDEDVEHYLHRRQPFLMAH